MIFSATTLIGNEVENLKDEDLGELKEIMFDANTGKIAYAVIDFGGFLGIGNKLFAVPWSALKVDTEEHEIILDVDKSVLENAEGFDQDNWPDFANQAWGEKVHSHYGQRPYWQ